MGKENWQCLLLSFIHSSYLVLAILYSPSCFIRSRFQYLFWCLAVHAEHMSNLVLVNSWSDLSVVMKVLLWQILHVMLVYRFCELRPPVQAVRVTRVIEQVFYVMWRESDEGSFDIYNWFDQRNAHLWLSFLEKWEALCRGWVF